ncbi:MAG: hypothetical protein HY775_13225 [Acidobacteria bacterium]|nr:hypothetical protein [Acidobacteriota bacterium]
MTTPSVIAPIACAGCGSLFRSAYTDGRCPVCDWEAPGAGAPRRPAGPAERAAAFLRRRWAPALLAVAVVGNIVIAVLVASGTSGH